MQVHHKKHKPSTLQRGERLHSTTCQHCTSTRDRDTNLLPYTKKDQEFYFVGFVCAFFPHRRGQKQNTQLTEAPLTPHRASLTQGTEPGNSERPDEPLTRGAAEAAQPKAPQAAPRGRATPRGREGPASARPRRPRPALTFGKRLLGGHLVPPHRQRSAQDHAAPGATARRPAAAAAPLGLGHARKLLHGERSPRKNRAGTGGKRRPGSAPLHMPAAGSRRGGGGGRGRRKEQSQLRAAGAAEGTPRAVPGAAAPPARGLTAQARPCPSRKYPPGRKCGRRCTCRGSEARAPPPPPGFPLAGRRALPRGKWREALKGTCPGGTRTAQNLPSGWSLAALTASVVLRRPSPDWDVPSGRSMWEAKGCGDGVVVIAVVKMAPHARAYGAS